jgi:hypothetical protein
MTEEKGPRGPFPDSGQPLGRLHFFSAPQVNDLPPPPPGKSA